MSSWQVGDLAVCVNDSPCGCCGEPHPIKIGRAYRVEGLHRHPDRLGLFVGVAVGRHPSINANRFRKIRPDEHEACEPEFVTLLKRSKVSA